jgi:predicted glycosyltransferase
MAPRARVLIYSHDSFGLGHIRRCRTLAHAVAEAFKGVDVLIVSGSPIIGSFDFKARVDFVRVPGLIKLRNGEYESLARHRPVTETTRLRAAMIAQTIKDYAPDILIVDKEPLGLRGELEPSLADLKARGAKLVLGLRDVLDAPDVLAGEWERKRVYPAVESLYDAIWIYGLRSFYEPLQGLPLSAAALAKVTYTGYLRRRTPEHRDHDETRAESHPDHILVTAGGGGDGEELFDAVLSAYESAPQGLPEALLVLGPFMPAQARIAFRSRADADPRLHVITFDARLERRMVDAAGVVAMGGYNTFCEILSYDRPAVLLPRTRPRMEQAIRAMRAQALGLCAVLGEAGPGALPPEPQETVAALRALSRQAPPSRCAIPGLLEGIPSVVRALEPWLGPGRVP